MDDPPPTLLDDIRTLYAAGTPPWQILATLRAGGGGREIADYVRSALDLNPDSISYIWG
jgi:hypothetical protein